MCASRTLTDQRYSLARAAIRWHRAYLKMSTQNTIPSILTADIGGTWLKLARFDGDNRIPVASLRLANPCREGRAEGFTRELQIGLTELLDGRIAKGIGISTAGIVDYAGRCVSAGHTYLDALKT